MPKPFDFHAMLSEEEAVLVDACAAIDRRPRSSMIGSIVRTYMEARLSKDAALRQVLELYRSSKQKGTIPQWPDTLRSDDVNGQTEQQS